MFDVLNSCARKTASALAVVLMTIAPATAQTTAAPAAPAATKPAAIPDVQPEPPASAVAAARDLVVASGISRSFTPMPLQLMDQIVPMLTRTRPELKANLTQILSDLRPDFIRKGEDMIDITAKIYARRMSEQELKDAAAFFNSPVGKKYVDVQPLMLDELVIAMQSFTQQLSTYMMTRIRDEMKKKGQEF